MQFTLKIKMNNSAFAEGYEQELERLIKLAGTKACYLSQKQGSLLDINGNSVGEFKINGK